MRPVKDTFLIICKTDCCSVGGTGHIGGAVLDAICTTYPEVELTALVRDEQKANRLVSKYPYVIPVIGGLNSLELLKSASESADIVISMTALES